MTHTGDFLPFKTCLLRNAQVDRQQDRDRHDGL